MGRPSMYNNEETKEKLQYLVYLYKKQNPSGIIRISDMVRFSKEISQSDPNNYPFYNKDVWTVYGREYIETANEPIRTELTYDGEIVVNMPNIADLVEKHGDNKQKMLEYLLPFEQMLHNALLKEKQLQHKLENLQVDYDALTEKFKIQQNVIKKYENFVMTMAHESYRKDFENDLKNQISVNANERNKSAMRNVGNLALFMESSSPKDPIESKSILEPKPKPTNSLLSHWKSKQ